MALLLLTACGPDELPPLPPSPEVPEPDPGSVESVVFLWGDGGAATVETHPILHRLRSEVERWSALLERDSAVSIVALGDIVYPVGLRPPAHEEHERDSARAAAHAWVVAGPAARANRSFHLLTAGNHDWGGMDDLAGVLRLRNLGDFMERRHREGIWIELLPRAGEGGPAVVDQGESLRLVLLDTAWWLYLASDADEQALLDSLATVLVGAGGRTVVMASHHPYRSAGPHGERRAFFDKLGIPWLLQRTGAQLQDLNSGPYRRLRAGIRRLHEAGLGPTIYAGGHDHSLQIIRGRGDDEPDHTLVSGSGSKLTDVGHVDGMVFRRSEPGYMRLMVLEDGGLLLFTESAPARYLSCAEDDDEAPIPLTEALRTCLEEGAEAFRVVDARRLR